MTHPNPDIHDTFQQALHLHQQGQLPQAESLYRQILQQNPNHVEALHMLGVLAGQANRLDIAITLIQKAVILQPNFPEAFLNLGHVLWRSGQLPEAIAANRQAIALRPDFAEAHGNLSVVLRATGSLTDAIAAARQAIALKPDFAEAHLNLGNALKDAGQLEEAIAAYQHVITLRPDFPEAYSNLGNTLRELGHLDQALALGRQAVTVNPNFPDAHNSLGSALEATGDLQQAITEYQRAIALNPHYAEAHNNLGNALRAAHQPDPAVAAYRQAIALKPDYAEAHLNLGNALRDLSQLDDALAAYRQALALNPRLSIAHSNIVFTMHYHPAYDMPAIADELARWNNQHASAPRLPLHPTTPDPDRPPPALRIGYVSPDFRDHPVGRHLDLLLAHHNRTHFEITLYADLLRPDDWTRQLQSHGHTWRNITALNNSQLADAIRDDRIDILVDLALHTQGNRLLTFACKPAPIQVSFAGYPGSAGLHAIDYRLTDPHLEPPPPPGLFDHLFPDKPLRLPHSFWCYNPNSPEPPVNPLPAATAPGITFGCLNNFCKINTPTLQLWAQVLHAVPNSRLVLLASEGTHRQRIAATLHSAGIAPTRLDFLTPRAHLQYLHLFHHLDISLDTLPYNGHITTLDSLFMGVPVITLVGNTIVGRAGLSQLTNVGHPELVAHSPEQFIHIATTLANDLPRLTHLRQSLRAQLLASPIANAEAATHAIETSFHQIWHQWRTTQPH